MTPPLTDLIFVYVLEQIFFFTLLNVGISLKARTSAITVTDNAKLRQVKNKNTNKTKKMEKMQIKCVT